MSKKMSYANAVEAVLNGQEITDEVRERLEALKVSLEKRGTRKAVGPTKAQKANAELAERIFSAMNADEVYDTDGIRGLVEELATATPQKISPLMKGLVNSGRVTSEKVKGKATYRVA